MMGANIGSWKPAFTAAAVFLAWTMTSFLCQECAKLFLQLSEEKFLGSRGKESHKELSFIKFSLAVLITIVQCSCCFLLVRSESGPWNLFQSKAMALLISAHALATLATNYSMVFIEASSTFAIKMTEPITMAVAHHVIFRTCVPVQTAVSIPLITCGALVFTGLNVHFLGDTAGVVLALLSNLILAARNVTIKKLQHGSTERSSIVLKPFLTLSLTVLCQIILVTFVYILERMHVVPRACSLLVGLSLASGIFHVSFSYISTNIVLKVMNVISHSIANIFKRFLVVLLLSALGNRHVSGDNYMGLAMAVCGLFIYTYGKRSAHHEERTEVAVAGKNTDGDYNAQEPTRRKYLRNIILLAPLAVATLMLIDKSAFHPTLTSSHNKTNPYIYRESHGLTNIEVSTTNISSLNSVETNFDMREFLSWRLVDYPEETDKRAPTLTTSKDIVEEAQRILINLLQDLLGNVKHVMLLEIATYENKGDPAIAVGEIMLLRRMNVSIEYYCETIFCSSTKSVSQAIEVNNKFAKDELIILLQGGGNLVGYREIDDIRAKFIKAFPERKMILLSQSIWLNAKNVKDLEYCKQLYSNHTNLTIFLRDRQSLEIAKKNFKGVNLILAPDMAFCIGMVPRQLPPLYDIVWLKRGDSESTRYKLPAFPSNLSVDVADWSQWKSNKGKSGMQNTFLIATAGFQFLQRGRIVVTDRLHGHILSTMMDIPHVLIDNPPHFKLSSFDKSWTKSLSNTVMVSNGSLALEAAQELLKRYHSSLPSLGLKETYFHRTTVRPALMTRRIIPRTGRTTFMPHRFHRRG